MSLCLFLTDFPLVFSLLEDQGLCFSLMSLQENVLIRSNTPKAARNLNSYPFSGSLGCKWTGLQSRRKRKPYKKSTGVEQALDQPLQGAEGERVPNGRSLKL